MKYRIYRTTSDRDKPCEKAEFVAADKIYNRIIWSIELNSLEELHGLVEQPKEEDECNGVILNRVSLPSEATEAAGLKWEIEIYDGYRE